MQQLRFPAALLGAGLFVIVASTSASAGRCPRPNLPPGVTAEGARIRFTPGCVAFVRTPSRNTKRLPGFPYNSKYVKLDGLRMRYVDVGPKSGQVVLLLHGQPAWSYLYRKMIPVLVAGGFRVIAPDLIGMGRSDKPVELAQYSYLKHVGWVKQFLDNVRRERKFGSPLGLQNITAFVQDWGSLIGLRVIGDLPDRFARVVIANGVLPVIPVETQLVTLPDPPILNPYPFPFEDSFCDYGDWPCFETWATFALTSTLFSPGGVVEAGTASDLTPAEVAAYDAPFPSQIYRAGPRVFPSLVNTLGQSPTNVGARATFDAMTKPLLTLFGRLDALLGTDAVQAEMRDTVPGAVGQPHHAYPDAHHFIQEDKGDDLAARVVTFINANPL
jgi:haloalkane dehalogenase